MVIHRISSILKVILGQICFLPSSFLTCTELCCYELGIVMQRKSVAVVSKQITYH